MLLDRVRRIEEALWSGCRLGSGNGFAELVAEGAPFWRLVQEVPSVATG